MSYLEQKQVVNTKKRGPRRLEYLPEEYRGISGIEHLTTARQLENLKTWLTTPIETRPVFIKLGCSVSHGEKRLTNPPSSTWAASVNGKLQIVHIVKDPRSAYKWMGCAARPWNIADQHEPKAEVAKYWFAVMERADGYVLEANGSTILSVTRRKIRKGANEGKMELLVEGSYAWWEEGGLKEKVIRVRAAFGEIYAGEDGSVWVTASKIKLFPPFTFADWVLMGSNREAVADVYRFIEDQAVDRVWEKISFTNVAKPILPADDAIIRSVLKKGKLDEISPEELDELVPHVAALLAAVGGEA